MGTRLSAVGVLGASLVVVVASACGSNSNDAQPPPVGVDAAAFESGAVDSGPRDWEAGTDGSTPDGSAAEDSGAFESGAVASLDGGFLEEAGVDDWQWLTVPGAVCGDGSPTGIGVSMGTSSNLLILLDGGGLCWNQVTCQALATNIFGFQQPQAAPRLAALSGAEGSFFDRTGTDNPFKTWNFVFIPYCTGDTHGGDATQTWTDPLLPHNGFTMHYAGRTNVAADLEQIVPMFPNMSHVMLYGASAGGYGAVFNYERVKAAFGDVTVDLLDDAGPVFHESELGAPTAGFAVWNLPAGFPTGCPACQTDVNAVYSYLSTTYPTTRFGFTEYDQDAVISLLTSQEPAYPVFYSDLRSMTQALPSSNWRYFIPDGIYHGVFNTLVTVTANSNPLGNLDPLLPHTVSPDLGTWLTNMMSRTGSWDNYTAQ